MNTKLKYTAILAASMWVTIGSAQAGMGPCMLGQSSSSTSCASQPGTQPACPRQGDSQGSSCASGNPEMTGMMGNMAAGGMQIAANVMGALIHQAGKVVDLGR